jgi:hypothetical protein
MAILKGVTFLDPAWTKSITPRLMPAALATKVDSPALPVSPKNPRLLGCVNVVILSPRLKKPFGQTWCDGLTSVGSQMVCTNKEIIKLNISVDL